MTEEVVPGPEPQPPVELVGRVVAFDLHRLGGKITREAGEVTSQKWLGRTKRGLIPEYELVIVGRSGVAVKARLTEHYVQPVESKLNPNPKMNPTTKYDHNRSTQPNRVYSKV